ncbi:MAG: DUF799 domain-containing protein [Rikenellaceae bacterium]|jgi:hypothetical protein|nr:DUF799 domain-containing protein [Rikenellaceae bacterium]
MKKIALAAIAAFILAGCATHTATKSEKYAAIYSQKPAAILVMPPINRSTKIEAKEVFYSSLIVPLSQRGYYVMPPLLTMEILKEESAYDAEMFINSSMKRVGELFGVDAVLFTTIHEWSKTTIASQIRVTLEYSLKSAKTDEILFNRKGTVIYSPQSNNSGAGFAGMVANMAAQMLTTALTKEIEIGRKCNYYILNDIPQGKYGPQFGQDGAQGAGDAEFKVTLH